MVSGGYAVAITGYLPWKNFRVDIKSTFSQIKESFLYEQDQGLDKIYIGQYNSEYTIKIDDTIKLWRNDARATSEAKRA